MRMAAAFYDALIDAVGTESLSDAIMAAADAEVGVDEVFGYWFERDRAPMRIASCGRFGSSVARAALYSERFYAMDPLAWAARALRDGDTTRFGRIDAADVSDPTYRRECYDRPGFSEKLSFARRYGSRHYVLSFYRKRHRRPAACESLVDLSEVVLPLLKKQVELIGDGLEGSLAARVERRLARAFPLLTGREKEVCARTIVGMTAEAIGLDLGVSATTVLTYRRRAYARYALSSVQQMTSKLLA